TGATAFGYGGDALDRNVVEAAEHGWSGKEALGPVLMGLEETKEPGALGEARKQRLIVTRQPPREGPIADTFERMQEPQGHRLTGPERRFGMFREGVQLFIDLIKQRGDQLLDGHTALLSGARCYASQRGRVVERLQAQTWIF